MNHAPGLIVLHSERQPAAQAVRIEDAAAEYSADPQAIARRTLEHGLLAVLAELEQRRQFAAAWATRAR